MIGRRPDFARLAALERARARAGVPDHARNLAVAEARALGVWPPPRPAAVGEHKLRVTRAFNVRVAPR